MATSYAESDTTERLNWTDVLREPIKETLQLCYVSPPSGAPGANSFLVEPSTTWGTWVEPSTTWGYNDLSKSCPVHMRFHWPYGKKLWLDFPPADVLGSMRRQKIHSTLAENLMLWNSQQLKSTWQLALYWQRDNRFPLSPQNIRSVLF